MNKALKVFKYQSKTTINSVLIFYGIFLSIIIFIGYMFRNFGNVSSAGVELSTAIFLFVAGLNSFKPPFYFAQLNNITRRDFILGTTLYAGCFSIVLSAVDIAINRIYNIFVQCPMNFDMIYFDINEVMNLSFQVNNDVSHIIKTFMFTAAAYMFVMMLGLILSMITFRLNSLGKTIFWGGSAALFVLGGTPILSDIFVAIGEFIVTIFGVQSQNSLLGVVSFLVISAILICGQYLLIRKAEANKF